MRLAPYYRVSTKKQEVSGLGLDAQRAQAEAFASSNQGEIKAEFTEVESGKRKDRPVLAKALEYCRLTGATLVVAKLDRLARNVAFLSALMESGVPFVCCDNPHANKLTLHVLAAVAENEAAMISLRTKDALAAARRRGTKLGGENEACRNLDVAGRIRGAKAGGKAVRKAAQAHKRALAPIVHALEAEGMEPDAIAQELNQRGYTTRQGKPWTTRAVLPIMRLCEVQT